MSEKQESYLPALTDRINRLLRAVDELLRENARLKEDAVSRPENGASEDRLEALLTELRELKRENKTLKERERLIKNKLERLAVKLEDVDV